VNVVGRTFASGWVIGAIRFGSIQWCVWSFRPSSPARLPRLKFLLGLVGCFVMGKWATRVLSLLIIS
jgi:hypothetical protein